MKLLLLLAVAVTANAATLGSSKCSHGPTYWCGSIKQAKECGAVQYCSDNDWAAIRTKAGEFCNDCEIDVGLLTEQLEKASTEDEIIQIVEKFCTDLGALAEDCRLVVNAYGPEMLKALIEKLQPDQVCALLGFCKPDTSVTDPQEDQSAQIMLQLMDRASSKLLEILGTQLFAGDKMCTDCTNFIGDVKKLLNNATVEAMITGEVKRLCQYLGAYKTECELIVTTLVPQGIGQLVEKINAKQDCSQIGFCKSLHSDEPVPEPPTNDPCSDCKAFMGDVKTILSNSSVQKMIIEDLENFCNDLGSLAPQCQEYVEQYGSLVFSLILQYFDPNMICSTIGFCKSEEMVVASFDVCTECKTYMGDFVQFLNTPSVQQNVMKQVTSICKMLKISDNCDQVVSEYGPLIMKMLLQYLNPESFCKEIGVCASEAIPEALPEPGDLCTDCQSFVKDFDNLLNNYTVQEMLLKDFEVLCKYVPNYSSDCKMYIKQYGALVFEVIAGLINPKTVCTDIGLCNGVRSPRPTLPKLPVEVLKALAPNDVCADCKNLFQDVQNFLSEPDVQKKILGEIELLCNDLGPFGPQCKTYVDQYGPLVFTFLLQYIDPDAICSKVGLCSADLPQSPAKVNADMCADCKAFFTDVSTILNTPQVQQMILQEIESLCNDLGPSIGPQCQQYVTEYGPLVINFVLQYLDPTSICGDIGFCTGVNTVRPLAFTAVKTILKMPMVAGDLCTDCKNLVNDADGLLKNATVQKMFLNDLAVVCKYFGGLQSECKDLIMEYGPLLFDYIAAYIGQNGIVDPTTICDDIGLCPAVTVTLKADQCADCKNFFQDVVTILNNPSTQQQILQAIETLCNDLGPSIGPQCQQYVSEYGPLAINFLLQYLDPTAVCGDIGFCPSVARPPMNLVKESADQCTDCKNFFQDVSTMLNTPAVQQQILQEIETLCNDLGPSIGPQCQQYVSEYGPLAINFLLQYLDPNMICGEIGFCAALPKQSLSFPSLNGDQCTDCKNFFQDVATLLKNSSVQQMILQEIGMLCNELGPSIGPQCQQYVTEYGPLVFNMLLQYLDPTAICGDIGFCTAVSSPPPLHLNGDQCTDCKNFFQDVSTMLKNTSTQQMILQELETLCNNLGPSIGPQCQQYVSEYGPLVFNFLLQYLDPTAICGDIGFCPAMSEPTKLFQLNADQCTDCKNFFQDVSTILNNPSTQQMIIEDIENLCNSLGPSLGPQCQQYVSEYGSLVINFLLQYLDPNAICGDIGFCSSTPRSFEKLVKVNADQCTDCKNFFQDVVTILNNPSTQQQILQELETLCNDLGPSIGPQCQQYVSEYGPLVINFLLQYLDPASVCSQIGFCSGMNEVISFVELQSALPVSPMNEEPLEEEGAGCEVCKLVVSQIEVYLKDGATEEEITAALEKFCSILPSSLANQCTAFMDQYGPVVLKLLADEMDPDQVCSFLKLCAAEFQQSPKCTLCEYVMQKLETMISKQSTVAEIEAALEKVCSLLPGSISDQCQQFVDQYTPTIINLIVQNVSPQLICRTLGLCKASSESEFQQSPKCTLCEYVIQKLETMISKQSTVAEIEAALEKVCSLLPGSISDQCQQFVDQYTPTIINLIVQNVSPQLICRTLGLCKASSESDVHEQLGPTCVLCQYVMKELESLLAKESTISDIEAALDKVCSLMPGTLSQQCQQFVDTYTPTIVNLLVQYVPPRLVCVVLRLCMFEEAPAPVLNEGANEFCAICEFAMSELDKILVEPNTEAQIENALDMICGLLPSTISETCTSFVAQYTKEIIFLITQSVSPKQVCAALTLCTTVESADEVSPDETLDHIDEHEFEASTECIVCEYAMKELEKQLGKNATEQEIRFALDEVCSLLPGTLQEDCSILVNYYTTEVIYQFIRKYPANKICTLLKVCAAVDGELKSVAHVEVEQEPSCAICEFAVKELEQMLQKDSTEASIRKALNSLCSRLPSTVAKDCQMFVDYYTEEIIFVLVSQFPPSSLCTSINLCTASEIKGVTEKVEQNTQFCTICEFVAKYLEEDLQKNSTEAEIKKALDLVCSKLPSTVTKECQMFVDYYTEEIIFILVSQFPPSKLCSSLQLCSAVEEIQPQIDEDTSVSCEVCVIAVRSAELYITKNTTEQEIDKVLEYLCQAFPGSLQEQCVTFVQQFGNAIPELIVTFGDPDKICKLLDLCPQNVDVKQLMYEKCKTGPEFWCASETNADLCDAVEHCKRHVWN
ncbi:uncharacterized protein [Apostichopus japonicus]|uniref:uncharacterized protein isoform X2 n=1 Tax=Stichopus japonicus TaxID=307972 RepID=UPI003AB52C5C